MKTKTKIPRLRSGQKGFTLLEILLVVAAIAILAGIVIIAINPTKQLGDTRNSQRSVDVNTILNGVYQYALDNNGTLPAAIPTGVGNAAEICATGVASAVCTTGGLVYLGELTTAEKYLVSIPQDPQGGVVANGAGYLIYKSANGRVTISAPKAENKTISVTR